MGSPGKRQWRLGWTWNQPKLKVENDWKDQAEVEPVSLGKWQCEAWRTKTPNYGSFPSAELWKVWGKRGEPRAWCREGRPSMSSRQKYHSADGSISLPLSWTAFTPHGSPGRSAQTSPTPDSPDWRLAGRPACQESSLWKLSWSTWGNERGPAILEHSKLFIITRALYSLSVG